MNSILSTIIFLPSLGAALSLLISGDDKRYHRSVALVTGLVTFALSCVLVANFSQSSTELQFVENHDWISTLKISYLIGVDGLSVVMIPLTALLFVLCTVASWDRSSGLRGYFSLLLLLETSILGTFAAQDLFLFFAFWGLSLLPIYFMVGVWGHKNREYAATKFFLYQLAGSVLLLLGMLAVYYVAEPHSFSLIDLSGGKFASTKLQIGDRELSFERIIFVLMLIGFAVRLPVVPLHSWFPHVQAEAPPALAVILAAVFIKTGAYAILRVNYTLFPNAANWAASFLAVAGTLNVIYAGICAFGQKDIRRLIAYSSVSHMGFVLLGLGIFSSTAFHGALLQMVSHGIYAALLFFLIGILGGRSSRYAIVDDEGNLGFGGVVNKAPILSGFFTVAVFSALGVPGLGAFASEALVFLGSFPFHRTLTIIGLCGVFLTAGYFLLMYRRVFLGPASENTSRIDDLTLREQFFLVPLVMLCVVVGTYPTPLIQLAHSTVNQVLHSLGKDGK